jgi:hypothetical protein
LIVAGRFALEADRATDPRNRRMPSRDGSRHREQERHDVIAALHVSPLVHHHLVDPLVVQLVEHP